jgi:hypothetical protein
MTPFDALIDYGMADLIVVVFACGNALVFITYVLVFDARSVRLRPWVGRTLRFIFHPRTKSRWRLWVKEPAWDIYAPRPETFKKLADAEADVVFWEENRGCTAVLMEERWDKDHWHGIGEDPNLLEQRKVVDMRATV